MAGEQLAGLLIPIHFGCSLIHLGALVCALIQQVGGAATQF
jgi:hypothetical protein